jgi:hypothetical protein
MSNKNNLIKLSVFFLVLVFSINFGFPQNNEVWKDIFDFSTVIQYWDQSNLSPNYNSVVLTTDYIYISDSYRNRIFGFSYDSKYVKEIKDIKTKNDLSFTPRILSFDSNKFYTVNEDYQHIFIINKTGDVLNDFKIKDSDEISSMFVKSGILFLNVRYTKKEKKRKLITVFSEKGKKMNKLGKLLNSQTHLGYIKFNSVKFIVKGNLLYGAFDYYPLIFVYDIRTKKEILWRDLRNKGLKEIDIMMKRVKEYKKDWINNIANDSIINLLRFCSGFDVDAEGNIYYLITADSKNEFPTTILKFSSHGKFLKRLQPEYKNKPIGYSLFLKVFNNSLYIIGGYEDNFHLFSAELSTL